MAWAVVAIVALLALPASALAAGPSVDIAAAATSESTTSAAPAPAAPAPSTTTPAPEAPAPEAAAPATAPGPVTLRIGARGPAVKVLQRELRRRGIRIAVDGEFGPATKRAVQRLQRRLGMRATGVANPAFLKRIRIQKRVVAAVSAPGTLAAAAPAGAPAGTSRFLDVFPVGGTYTYTADFGAPRSQGAHEGVDIMAADGTPLLAVSAGTIVRMSRVETDRAGISVWIERGDGTQYFYAHMRAITAGLAEGSAVSVGQVVGTVGNTGDARYGASHLHFEIHPGGGAAIDPYPHLMAVDPQQRAASR